MEPETGIVTAAELTKAAGVEAADGATGVRLLEADPTLAEGQPVDVLGDSAYGTGDALKAITDAGHTPPVKPWPTKPAVPGGFGIDEFTVDEEAGTATWPQRRHPPKSAGHVLQTRTAALNLRRLLNLGLARDEGAWTLA